MFSVLGHDVLVEYEGLHLIFLLRKYGHRDDLCPNDVTTLMVAVNQETNLVPSSSLGSNAVNKC